MSSMQKDSSLAPFLHDWMPYDTISEAPFLLRQILTGFQHSLDEGDLTRSFIYWILQLEQYLSLKHPLTLEHRIYLAKLLYHVLLLPDYDASSCPTLARVFVRLVKKRHLLADGCMTLPWSPLWTRLQKTYFTAERYRSLAQEQDSLTCLIQVLEQARRFFTKEAISEITSLSAPFFYPYEQNLMLRGQFLLTQFLPLHALSNDTLSPLLDQWFPLLDQCAHSGIWIHRWIEFSSRLSYQGLFLPLEWTKWAWINVNRFLELPSNHPLNNAIDPKWTILKNGLGDIIRCMAKIVIYQLEKESVLQECLDYFNITKSFYHPSNDGGWAYGLSRLLFTLAEELLCRVREEQKGLRKIQLPVAHQEALIEKLLPLTFMAMFGKDSSVTLAAQLTLKNLFVLDKKVITLVLEECLPCLEQLNETHRTQSALGAMIHLMRYKETILGDWMWLLLPGIDANDTMKTMLTLQCVVMWLLHYDEERIQFSLEEWQNQFMDRLILVLDNVPDDKDSLMATIHHTIHLLFQSVTNEQRHLQLLEKVQDYVLFHQKKERLTTCRVLCSASLGHFPLVTWNRLVPLLEREWKLELTNGACEDVNSSPSSLLSIQWILSAFRGLVQSREFNSSLLDLLQQTLNRPHRSVYSLAGKVLRSYLKALLCLYPVDDNTSLLKVPKWHVPTIEEQQQALNVLDHLVKPSMDHLAALQTPSVWNDEQIQTIQRHVYIMKSGLISIASMKEYQPKLHPFNLGITHQSMFTHYFQQIQSIAAKWLQLALLHRSHDLFLLHDLLSLLQHCLFSYLPQDYDQSNRFYQTFKGHLRHCLDEKHDYPRYLLLMKLELYQSFRAKSNIVCQDWNPHFIKLIFKVIQSPTKMMRQMSISFIARIIRIWPFRKKQIFNWCIEAMRESTDKSQLEGCIHCLMIPSLSKTIVRKYSHLNEFVEWCVYWMEKKDLDLTVQQSVFKVADFYVGKMIQPVMELFWDDFLAQQTTYNTPLNVNEKQELVQLQNKLISLLETQALQPRTMLTLFKLLQSLSRPEANGPNENLLLFLEKNITSDLPLIRNIAMASFTQNCYLMKEKSLKEKNYVTYWKSKTGAPLEPTPSEAKLTIDFIPTSILNESYFSRIFSFLAMENEDPSSPFNRLHFQYFKSLALHCPFPVLEQFLFPVLESAISNELVSYQKLTIVAMTGLIRGLFKRSTKERETFFSRFLSPLQQHWMLHSMSGPIVSQWTLAVRYMTKSIPIDRLTPLIQCLEFKQEDMHLGLVPLVRKLQLWQSLNHSLKNISYCNVERILDLGGSPFKQAREQLALYLKDSIVIQAYSTTNSSAYVALSRLFQEKIKLNESEVSARMESLVYSATNSSAVVTLPRLFQEKMKLNESEISAWTESLVYWMKKLLNSPFCGLAYSHLVENVFALLVDYLALDHLSQDTLNLVESAFVLLVTCPCPMSSIQSHFSLWLNALKAVSKWQTKCKLLKWSAIFYVRNIHALPTTCQKEFYNILLNSLESVVIEERISASDGLTCWLQCSNCPDEFEKLILQFKSMKTSSALHLQHGCILGYSSLIRSQPYSIPNWMPSVLVTLAQTLHDTSQSMVQTAIKETLREFKRTRVETLHLDKKMFTEEDWEMLSALLISPSYYA